MGLHCTVISCIFNVGHLSHGEVADFEGVLVVVAGVLQSGDMCGVGFLATMLRSSSFFVV